MRPGAAVLERSIEQRGPSEGGHAFGEDAALAAARAMFGPPADDPERTKGVTGAGDADGPPAAEEAGPAETDASEGAEAGAAALAAAPSEKAPVAGFVRRRHARRTTRSAPRSGVRASRRRIAARSTEGRGGFRSIPSASTSWRAITDIGKSLGPSSSAGMRGLGPMQHLTREEPSDACSAQWGQS